jgi:hypothetical protein
VGERCPLEDHRNIPDATKWRLAAECAAQLPALYDAAFRPVVGERYNEIEQEVWMDLSRMVSEIARNLKLPSGNARDLAETLRTIMTILFGPGFKNESLEVADDASVIVIKRCPLLDHGYQIGTDGAGTFHKCMALTLTAVPRLNDKYSARFVRTMCSGDRQCEVKVTRNEPSGTEKKNEKK